MNIVQITQHPPYAALQAEIEVLRYRNASLEQEVERLAIERERRVQAEQALRVQRDLAIALSSTSDLHEAMNRLLEMVLQIEGVDCGAVYLLDRQAGDLHVMAHTGLSREFVAVTARYDTGSDYVERVRRGQPMYGECANVLPVMHEVQQRENIHFLAAIPVCYEHEVIALLHAGSHTHSEIPASACLTMETIAAQIGGIIVRVESENARRESQRELQVVIESLRQAHNQLEIRVAERTARLYEANCLLEQSLAFLKQSEERYRTLVETAPDAILLIDLQGCILFCNLQTATMFRYAGVEDFLQMRWIELVAPEHTQQFQTFVCDMVQSGSIKNVECSMLRKDSSQFPAQVNSSVIRLDGKPASLIIVIRDVSQQKQLHAQLLENERFVTSGRLVTSVAHEINTPLLSLDFSLEMAQIAPAHEYHAFLADAREEIQRIARIVRQLLDLYRPGGDTYAQVDVSLLLERILLLTGKWVRDHRIVIQQDLVDAPPAVLGQADELMQVVLNLLFNAVNAMPEGGILSVQTRVLCVQEAGPYAYTAEHVKCLAIDKPTHVLIVIKDTGVGIAPDVRERIFEPFFTTRENGVGLGLAISTQIVQQHGGYFKVESVPGEGSVFSVILPVRKGREG
jgi:PAS domain S-box-containing protein